VFGAGKGALERSAADGADGWHTSSMVNGPRGYKLIEG
jgi:hypothetical protein